MMLPSSIKFCQGDNEYLNRNADFDDATVIHQVLSGW